MTKILEKRKQKLQLCVTEVNNHIYLVMILRYWRAFAAEFNLAWLGDCPIPKHTVTGLVDNCTKQWFLSSFDFSSTSTYVTKKSCSFEILSRNSSGSCCAASKLAELCSPAKWGPRLTFRSLWNLKKESTCWWSILLFDEVLQRAMPVIQIVEFFHTILK